MRHVVLLLSALMVLCIYGCAGRNGNGTPSVPLAVDGPPLAVYGEYMGMILEGTLDRAGMVGYGILELQSAEGQGVSPAVLAGSPPQAPNSGISRDMADNSFLCRAIIKEAPTEKGRVRGLLACTGDRQLPFSLRNLGPDQGVGIAKEAAHDDLMIFFYHPSKEEAQRRFPQVAQDILAARALRDNK